MEQNVAGQFAVLYAFDSSTNAPVINGQAQITPNVSINGGAVANLANTTVTQLDSVKSPGVYLSSPSQAETNGKLLIFDGVSSTLNVVILPHIVTTIPPNWLMSLTSTERTNIATAIWSAALSGMVVAGSIGEFLSTYITGIWSALTTIGTNVTSLLTNLAATNTTVNTINATVNTINTNVNTANTNIGVVNTNVQTVNTNVLAANTDIDTANTTLSGLITDIADIADTVDRTEEFLKANKKINTTNPAQWTADVVRASDDTVLLTQELSDVLGNPITSVDQIPANMVAP